MKPEQIMSMQAKAAAIINSFDAEKESPLEAIFVLVACIGVIVKELPKETQQSVIDGVYEYLTRFVQIELDTEIPLQ